MLRRLKGLTIVTKAFCFLVVLSTTCTRKKSNVGIIDNPSFDLKKNLSDFSNTLEEDDTLFLLVDASSCMWIQKDSVVFIKKNDKVYVNTTIHLSVFEDDTHQLGNIQYSKVTDSLNYEDLFNLLLKKNIKPNSRSVNTFTVIHKKDTLQLYSKLIGEFPEDLGYYIQIQRRLYPDAEEYQPVKVSEPEEEL